MKIHWALFEQWTDMAIVTKGIFANPFEKLSFDYLGFANLGVIKSGFLVIDLCLGTLLFNVALVEWILFR